MITINWNTKIITIPTSFMTLVSGVPGTGNNQANPALYDLDVNALRLALKDIEDSDGMPYLDTHRHNSEVTISGVTYARTFELINGYTVNFDSTTYDHYTVRCFGANHNLAEARQPSTVSLIIGNSAGLIVTAGGGGSGAWSDISEDGETYGESIRLMRAILLGLTDIVGNTVYFKSKNGVTNRVTATMVASERTAIVTDPD